MNNTITGTEIVKGIQALLAEQSLSSQNRRQIATTMVISEFAQDHGIPAQSGAISVIAKALKHGDDLAIEMVRELAPSMHSLKDEEARNHLGELRNQLGRIQAKAHQTKNRSSFIAAFLRPFTAQYTNKWFSERTDIDVSEAKLMIEYLERKSVSNLRDLKDWADDVVELFTQVVVFIDRDPDARFTRPIGTVSEKSARTYLQSWGAFIEDEAANILRLAIDVKEGPNQRSIDADLSLSRAGQISELLKKPSFSSKNISARRPTVSTISKLENNHGAHVAHSLTIEVSVSSNIDVAATAKRKWLTKEDFTNSIRDWIATFPILWSDAANDLNATIRLQQTTGESEISLPKLSIDSAAEKICKAAELQI